MRKAMCAPRNLGYLGLGVALNISDLQELGVLGVECSTQHIRLALKLQTQVRRHPYGKIPVRGNVRE